VPELDLGVLDGDVREVHPEALAPGLEPRGRADRREAERVLTPVEDA
jgi:hypothetical protein